MIKQNYFGQLLVMWFVLEIDALTTFYLENMY